MNPMNFPACPSCGKALQSADVFDQRAGFPHADCVCGYRTKPAKEAQSHAPSIQSLSANSANRDFVAGQALWSEAQAKVSKFDLAESAEMLSESAALLLRIAMTDASDEARIVQGWLWNMGLAGGLAKLAVRAVDDWQAGEGPRSGGGAATSGAGAQRKEGVQPPGDLAAVVGARA
ncbi:hypothetical protein [Paracidovorax sp. MALMAid1276]|uniref:hypothetical protein n=1 Tax=Paracidovorax sp. MALMAid1276 TaxID=3411631 RepID=UPI003B9BDDF3